MRTNIIIDDTLMSDVLKVTGVKSKRATRLMISTFCTENDFPLLHSDKDFQPFQQLLGLNVV